MSRNQILIALGLVVLLAAGAVAWFLMESPGATAGAAGPGYTLTAHDRTMGNPKAPVVLIEYAAHSCPVCARFNGEVVPQLKANYIDTGKVFYVFRLFPLRSDDGAAEKIARCLPEDKYFSFVDLLFRNQSKWDVEYGLSPEQVRAGLILQGRIAGMSTEQVDQCMNSTAEDETINTVAKDGETKYSITGTPTIIVNGVALPSGYIPFADLKKTIDAELAKKK